MNVDSAARRLIDAVTDELEMSAHHGLKTWAKYCESPIEALFLSALTIGWALSDWEYDHGGCRSYFLVRRQSEMPKERLEKQLIVVPQYQWEKFRLDFAFLRGVNDTPSVFVECDGHDFHERTPEQAERDRSRDRTVQLAGIPILRFTGREIYRDPFSCVIQTLDLATS